MPVLPTFRARLLTMTPAQRTAIYTLATAVASLAILYGLVTDVQAAAWVAAFSALLGTVTAFVNRPTRPQP